MSITLEKIDLIRSRANVSYQEAKEALEECNFDEVEALIYLENKRTNKTKSKYGKNENFGTKVKELIDKLNSIKCSLQKGDQVFLNLPLSIVILLGLFLLPATPLVLIGLVVIIALGFKITIIEENKEPIEVSKVVEDTIEKVKSTINIEKDE